MKVKRILDRPVKAYQEIVVKIDKEEVPGLLVDFGTNGIAGNGYTNDDTNMKYICIKNSSGKYYPFETIDRMSNYLVTDCYVTAIKTIGNIVINNDFIAPTACGCIKREG